jgi:hypothetical protein
LVHIFHICCMLRQIKRNAPWSPFLHRGRVRIGYGQTREDAFPLPKAYGGLLSGFSPV